jgi:hypothetical protein
MLLWSIGNQGSVTGDVFVKVAYEDAYQTGVDQDGLPIPGVLQRFMPGRVRIIPLNSSYCFPEWHPHDRERLLRFKVKYRFWGCLTPDAEVLTRRGWMTRDDLVDGDELYVLDPETDEATWAAPSAVSTYAYDGEMVRWSGRVDAFATPNHRWLGEVQRGRGDTTRYERQTVHGEFVREVRKGSRLVVGGGTPLGFADTPKWSDELVETVGWYVTEGTDHYNQTGFHSVYLSQKGERGLADIRRLGSWWRSQGGSFNEYRPRADGVVSFHLGVGVVGALQDAAPRKQLTPEFLTSLTHAQAVLLRKVLLDADGCRTHGDRNSARWTQIDQGHRDAYQMLCAMLGIRTNAGSDAEKVQEYQSRYAQTRHLHETREHYTGEVWCPTVPTGYFMMRRNGVTSWTGNTTPEGTRQVYTYTELMTEQYIEEYINDQLVDARPNPLGTIPIANCPNIMLTGSPWGRSDVEDILILNREYNEKATDVADIVNYHAAPVTIMTGAKSSQLEKGAKKIWGGLPKEANVYNLELAGGGVAAGLSYLEMIKKAMHELTGVPEGALGDVQPISNTSGVALAIQYQPMMQRYNHKKMTYSALLRRVNELVIMTIALKEPLELQYDPSYDPSGGLRDYQQPVLDVDDPITYQTVIHFPPPLPVDKMVLLNEIMLKMQIGIMSKREALEDLGEVFPDEKMSELFLELLEDAVNQGALDMLRAQVSQIVQQETGQFIPGAPQPFPPPVAGGGGVTSAGGPDVNSAGAGGAGPAMSMGGFGMPLSPGTEKLMGMLTNRAYGTQDAMRMPPKQQSDDDADS